MMKIPTNLSIRVLREDEWHLVREKYETTFENGMPSGAEQSMFLGAFLGDKLIGFTHLETVFHLNAIYFEDEYRHKGMCSIIFKEIDKLIPQGFPLIILPDKNFSHIREKFKMRDLGETHIWRKDY